MDIRELHYPDSDKTYQYKCIRGRNNLFLLDWPFLVLMQSHCSSPIATKDFGNAVIPLFCPAFAGSFPHFSYKEVPDP